MSASRKRRLSGRRSGQGLVEFAVVLPLLLILLLGVVEFARAWNVAHVMTDAAREGARRAVVGLESASEREDAALAVVSSALIRGAINPADADINVIAGVASGDTTFVTIEYPFQFRVIDGLIGWTGADATLTLRTNMAMRTE